MGKSRNELLDDSCWVYISISGTGVYTVGITYDEDFGGQDLPEGSSIIFRRRFDDTFTAAGYRMVLEKLPEEQLERIIREYEHKNNK